MIGMIVHRLALALGACALLSFVATPRPAAADDSLTLVAGSAAPGIFDTLDLVAIGAGFFKEQHLSITKQYVAGPGPAAQLVATGKVDIGEMSVDPVLIGYERGLRLQFFLGRGSRYSYVLAVLPDSRIKSLADFKGAVLGETAPNTADVAAQSMLAGVGLKKSDYSFVTIGTGAAALTAITSKRVDGVAFPYLEVVNDDIAANTELRVFRHPILQDIVNSGYAAAPATIQSRSDVLKRFSRAIVEAALFVRANPAAAARLYLQGSGQAVTDETLDRTTRVLTLYEGDFPAADPSSRRIGLLSPGGLQLYSRYLADYGMTQTLVPGATIATDQFIPFANAFDHKKIEAFAKSMH
jgi:NitT/TauT family transport system substrate-binding protein